MFNPSARICASCEALVNRQDSIPIPRHRNSEFCARRRNSSLEITTVDTLTEWYPRRELQRIPHALRICQALSELDPSSLFVVRALRYGCFPFLFLSPRPGPWIQQITWNTTMELRERKLIWWLYGRICWMTWQWGTVFSFKEFPCNIINQCFCFVFKLFYRIKSF